MTCSRCNCSGPNPECFVCDQSSNEELDSFSLAKELRMQNKFEMSLETIKSQVNSHEIQL